MHRGGGAGPPRARSCGRTSAGSVESRSVHLWPELMEAGWQPSLLIVRPVYNAQEER